MTNAKCRMQNARRPGRPVRLGGILHFAFVILHFAFPVLILLATPGVAHAADPSFPRGPGLYFSMPKLFLVLLFYLAWISTCWWVNHDAVALKQPADTWNSLLFGCGAAGLVVLWLLPWFAVGFGVMVVLYVTAALAYVSVRNQHVT